MTGPTGDIGRSLLRALDRSREVERVVAMARRPFDPRAAGLRKTEYRQGDVLDRNAIDELVAPADVVVHLAFVIMGRPRRDPGGQSDRLAQRVRGGGAGGCAAAVYASSVAAYGFHADNPSPLTEDVAPRGTERHYYSAQKAQLEGVLSDVLAGSQTDAYVFRPCIVAGPDALLLFDNIPYIQLSERMPSAIVRALELMPALKPVLPDPGVAFQLVHHDDVAAAFRAAVLGRGQPGVYNLAGAGTLTMSDLADALGWYSVPLPGHRGRRGGGNRGAVAVRARRGPVDRDLPRPGRDGHGQGSARASLAPAPRRPRDAPGDGRHRAVRAPDSLRLTPGGRLACFSAFCATGCDAKRQSSFHVPRDRACPEASLGCEGNDKGGEMDDEKQDPGWHSASADAAAARYGEKHPEDDLDHPPPAPIPEPEDEVPNRHSASAEAASLRWHEQHPDDD